MPGETLEARQHNTNYQVPPSAEVQAYETVRDFESITRAAAERQQELHEQAARAAEANGEAQDLAETSVPEQESDVPPEFMMPVEQLGQRIGGMSVNLSHYRYNRQMMEAAQD
jgi:hypothetical protein